MAKKQLPPPPRRRPTADEPPTADLPLWPETVQRGKLIEMLRKHVDGLRAHDRHGNRALFLDDVFIAYLLAFFNPSIRTLRTLEDFSQTQQAQKHLTIAKICRSTLSDFQKIADPERLGPILTALRSELARKGAQGRLPEDFHALHKQILAVDGTFLPAAAHVAWAVRSRNQRDGQRHRARFDWQVDIHTWLPELVVVPDPGQSEADSAARHIVPGSISIYDRGFLSFALIARFYDRDASTSTSTSTAAVMPRAEFVVRLKEPGPNAPTLEEVEVRPLDAAAHAAGVVSDRLVRLPGLERAEQLTVTLREVVVAGPDGKPVRLLTNLLTVPPQVIAFLYKCRWQIELFFKWLKCYANFNHMISHSREGVLLNFYVTIMGVMLMYLHTGFRPSKYALVLLGAVAQGATLAEILPILRERERQCEVARQSAAKRRANKKSETH
jgi:Transposase DDE domain